MDLVKIDADSFIKKYLDRGINDVKRTINKVDEAIDELENDAEKLRFYSLVIEGDQLEYDRHLVKCTNPTSCQINHEHERFARAMRKEIAQLGVELNADQFTTEEKYNSEKILNQILTDLKDLKDGQQLIYDDFEAEIEDLKKWFILSKKNWKELYLGKISNMVASGVIGETVAAPLVEYFKNDFYLT